MDDDTKPSIPPGRDTRPVRYEAGAMKVVSAMGEQRWIGLRYAYRGDKLVEAQACPVGDARRPTPLHDTREQAVEAAEAEMGKNETVGPLDSERADALRTTVLSLYAMLYAARDTLFNRAPMSPCLQMSGMEKRHYKDATRMWMSRRDLSTPLQQHGRPMPTIPILREDER